MVQAAHCERKRCHLWPCSIGSSGIDLVSTSLISGLREAFMRSFVAIAAASNRAATIEAIMPMEMRAALKTKRSRKCVVSTSSTASDKTPTLRITEKKKTAVRLKPQLGD